MVILSVDYGDARTGLAVCDKLEMLASPVGVIFEKYEPKVLEQVRLAAEKAKAQLIVVGLPRNMDGTFGERAEKCKALGAELEARTGVPVIYWDERRTTIEAHAILHASGKKQKKHKKNVDAVAASLILQGYLDFKRMQK